MRHLFTDTTVKVVDNGPGKTPVNILYTGGGYTTADLPKFKGQVDSEINYRKIPNMLVRPFPRYFKFCNFYRIDLVIAQSGIEENANNAISGRHDNDRLGWVNGSHRFNEPPQLHRNGCGREG